MNTKSVLIATLLAAASSVAFAAEVSPAAQKTEAAQVAQGNTGMRNVAPTARAGSNAATASCANTYNDATSMIVCTSNDGRTREQVREETRAWLNSPEGRAARAQTLGAR
jgi:copper(I)-binding protein